MMQALKRPIASLSLVVVFALGLLTISTYRARRRARA
ncbi:MAG: hypothetical protein QOI36_2109 [Pseudonocardiales bacterium]|jgi:hypothetical protein|nr:hypothetical protein [Pseudonocardia sp.]MDT7650703.1 hypothetical protein [Pseudonocardiales bacterium]